MKYQEYIEQVIKFTFNTQNKDGSWYYSFQYNTRKPKKQIDFHQGYVLESVLRIFKYTSLDSTQYKGQLQKGINFYFKNQFSKDGWAYWRLPFAHLNNTMNNIWNLLKKLLTGQSGTCKERMEIFTIKNGPF